MKLLIQLSKFIFLLCVAAFGIKSLKEPDIWWMLRTGEWIVEHGKVITQDHFSYTFEGVNWINVKWLFEVILYGVEQLGGPEFTPIIQSVVNLFVFILLGRRFRLLNESNNDSYHSFLAYLIVAFSVLVTIEFRMLGRPEMMSHLLTVFFIYLFEHYRKSPSNLIWWIIPLQILWVNIHEAFGIGIVMIVTMILGAFFDFMFTKRAVDKRFLAALIIALVATSINPRGPQMILHPFDIFGQVGLNKYTIELVGFTDALYWRKEGYLLFLFFVVSAVSLYKYNGDKKGIVKKLILTYGSGWLALFVLFFYLGFTAYRNIPFFVLFSAPLAFAFVNKAIDRFSGKAIKGTLYVVPAVLIGFYISIVSNTYYSSMNRGDTYGLRLDESKNPKGVSDFVKRLNLKGNVFSDYLTSSYFMWDLRPSFKTYIDLRDLDVFTTDFFEQYLKMSADGKLFDQEDEKYQFNYAIIYAAQFEGLHYHLDRSEAWEMVYADNVAALYLKRNAINNPIIDSLFSVQIGTVFKSVKPAKSSKIAHALSKIFNPWYDPSKLNKYDDYDLLGASFFSSIKDYNAAIYQCKQSIRTNGEQLNNLEMQGNLYLSFSKVVEEEVRPQLLEKAKQSYTKLMKRYPNAPNGFKGLGFYYSYIGDRVNAIKYFQKSNSIEYDEEIEQYLTKLAFPG